MSGTNAKVLLTNVTTTAATSTTFSNENNPGKEIAGDSFDNSTPTDKESSSSKVKGKNPKNSQGRGKGDMDGAEGMTEDDIEMMKILQEAAGKAIEAMRNQSLEQLETEALGLLESMVGDAKNAIKKEIAPHLEAHAEQLVLDRLGSIQPLQVTITDPITKEQVSDIYGGIRHTALEELIHTYNCGHKNIYLKGPAGAGKTTLAMTFAKILKAQFGGLSCTRGMSESWLLGRMLHDGSFVSTLFIDIYENGGVFLLDEVDALDSNMALVMNQAIEQGIMPLPNRRANPLAVRHPNAIILAAANDWGRGASLLYTGREPQDAAFVDRYMGAYIHVDYDLALEESMLGSQNKSLLETIWNIRDFISKNEIPVVVGTRMVRAAAMWDKYDSKLGAQEILRKLTRPWAPDVRARVGHVVLKNRNFLLTPQEALLYAHVEM